MCFIGRVTMPILKHWSITNCHYNAEPSPSMDTFALSPIQKILMTKCLVIKYCVVFVMPFQEVTVVFNDIGGWKIVGLFSFFLGTPFYVTMFSDEM